LGKGDGRKEEGRGRVDSSRRVICGIVFTGNVTGLDLVNVICLKEEGVNASEYVVGFSVAMSAIPPTLNDSSVVTIDDKVVIR